MTPEECFQLALKFVLKWEGGYSFRKDDPGGETNFGITDKRDGIIDGLVDIDGNKTGDVPIKQLTREQVGEIYRKQYWEKVGSSKDAEYGEYKLAIVVFDCAVNCGVRRTLEWLLKANASVQTPELLKIEQVIINQILRLREEHYVAQRKPQFLKGWMNRLNDLRSYVQTI